MSDIDFYDEYFTDPANLTSDNYVERTIAQYNTSTQSSRATTSYNSIHVQSNNNYLSSNTNNYLSTIHESSPTLSPLPLTIHRTMSPTILTNNTRPHSGSGLLSSMLNNQSRSTNNTLNNYLTSSPGVYSTNNTNDLSPLFQSQSEITNNIHSSSPPILHNEHATLASYSHHYISDHIVGGSSRYNDISSSSITNDQQYTNHTTHLYRRNSIDDMAVDTRYNDNSSNNNNTHNTVFRNTQLNHPPSADDASYGVLHNDYAVELCGRYIHQQTLIDSTNNNDVVYDQHTRLPSYQQQPSPVPRTRSAIIPVHNNPPNVYSQYNSYSDYYGDSGSGNSTPTLSASYNSTGSPHLGTRTSSHISHAIPIAGNTYSNQPSSSQYTLPNKRGKHHAVSASMPVDHMVPLDTIPENQVLQQINHTYTIGQQLHQQQPPPQPAIHVHNARHANRFDFISRSPASPPEQPINQTPYTAEQMLRAYAAKIAPKSQPTTSTSNTHRSTIAAQSSPTSSFHHLSLNSPGTVLSPQHNIIEAVPLVLDQSQFMIPLDQSFAGNGIGFKSKLNNNKSSNKLHRNKSGSTGDLIKLEQRKQTRLLRKAEQARASRARKKNVLAEMEAHVSLLERQVAEWTLERKKQRIQKLQLSQQQNKLNIKLQRKLSIDNTHNLTNDTIIGDIGSSNATRSSHTDHTMNFNESPDSNTSGSNISYNENDITRAQLITNVDELLQSVNHIVQPSSTEKLYSYLMSQSDEFYTRLPQLLLYEEINQSTLQSIFNTNNKSTLDCAQHWHELIIRMHLTDELLSQMLANRVELNKQWSVINGLSKYNRDTYSVFRSHIELMYGINDSINNIIAPIQLTSVSHWLHENNTITDILNQWCPTATLHADIQIADQAKRQQQLDESVSSLNSTNEQMSV